MWRKTNCAVRRIVAEEHSAVASNSQRKNVWRSLLYKIGHRVAESHKRSSAGRQLQRQMSSLLTSAPRVGPDKSEGQPTSARDPTRTSR